MATGDKAAAKGLAVYASTQDRRLGFDNDNKRGDEIADEIDARTSADAAILAKLGVTKIIVSATQPTYEAGVLWFKIL